MSDRSRSSGEYKGKQQLFEKQSPQVLSALREVARVQSIESSNRIEGVTAATGRVAELAAEKTTPRDRSEQEIAGYRDVLSTVHANALGMHVSTGLILQLHRDLYQFSPTPGGAWKSTANDIVDVLPDGTHRLRFSPVAPHLVEHGDERTGHGLRCRSVRRAGGLADRGPRLRARLPVHPPVLRRQRTDVAHPEPHAALPVRATTSAVTSASRRSSRTPRRPTTRRSRRRPRAGTRAGTTSCPWLQYSHGVLIAAYMEFEQRVGQMGTGRGAKREMVIDCIRHLPATFRYADVERACPGVSRPTIVRVLGELRRQR